ncbi:hypothetical protein BHAOGJBA_4251 [Methylobacterium hispanicum]|uniref:Uncharacterized protein n=1 Tax=Methylobacterium hispanicum TaxID=270350 RepID=A0AAV4ZQB1_9HYPH|nr:hypothetical protein [Methylobacterium hispanicum]GJD90709.1 hypothetical protein BHAOGJBA_4251 [Methylobacterium hispanicum]
MPAAITTNEMFDACFRIATGGDRDDRWAHISSLQKAVASVGVNAPRKLQIAAKERSKSRRQGGPVVISLANGDRIEASDSFEGLNMELARGDAVVKLRIVFYHHRFVATIREIRGDVETLMDVVLHFGGARKEILRALGETPAKRAKPRLTVVPLGSVAA